MLSILEHLGGFTWFALTALPAALLAWRRPGELFRQLYLIWLGAIPLGFVAGTGARLRHLDSSARRR